MVSRIRWDVCIPPIRRSLRDLTPRCRVPPSPSWVHFGTHLAIRVKVPAIDAEFERGAPKFLPAETATRWRAKDRPPKDRPHFRDLTPNPLSQEGEGAKKLDFMAFLLDPSPLSSWERGLGVRSRKVDRSFEGLYLPLQRVAGNYSRIARCVPK